MSLSNKQIIGQKTEQLALEYLQAKGLLLIERNWSCRAGELDLIMHDGATLVFAEVRYRKNNNFGGASASITPSKQKKIQLAAQFYLLRNPRWQNHPCRFDVMALEPKGESFSINWIQHAFLL